MNVWNFLLNNITDKKRCVLLYVLESEGSSPGRKGFVMAVNDAGLFEGTIGGGIMEVKLIELAKSCLLKGQRAPIIKEQFHNKSVATNQSGLICSGKQIVALIPIGEKDLPLLNSIVDRESVLLLSLNINSGLRLTTSGQKSDLESKQESSYDIVIPRPKTIHIFGAGHVGLALAEQMDMLNYKVHQYDDRPDLTISNKGGSLSNIEFIDYNKLSDAVQINKSDTVVIVSFSFRSDKVILKQLYDQPLAYIGMMGSENKIATLRRELEEEGIDAESLEHVFMPIGLNMYSKTAKEIALSIAGQIILENNKSLPTGRTYKL